METNAVAHLPSFNEQVKGLKEQIKNALPSEISAVFFKEAEDLGHRQGIIRFIFADGNYTKRVEPQTVLDVLATLK